MYGIDTIIYKDNDKKIFLLFFYGFYYCFLLLNPLWVGLFMKR